MEENEDQEKKPIDIEFTDQNLVLKIIETLDYQNLIRRGMKILLKLASLRAYKSKLIKKFILKSN